MDVKVSKKGMNRQVKRITAFLEEQGYPVPESLVREVCAKSLCHRDWNTLSARLTKDVIERSAGMEGHATSAAGAAVSAAAHPVADAVEVVLTYDDGAVERLSYCDNGDGLAFDRSEWVNFKSVGYVDTASFMAAGVELVRIYGDLWRELEDWGLVDQAVGLASRREISHDLLVELADSAQQESARPKVAGGCGAGKEDSAVIRDFNGARCFTAALAGTGVVFTSMPPENNPFKEARHRKVSFRLDSAQKAELVAYLTTVAALKAAQDWSRTAASFEGIKFAGADKQISFRKYPDHLSICLKSEISKGPDTLYSWGSLNLAGVEALLSFLTRDVPSPAAAQPAKPEVMPCRFVSVWDSGLAVETAGEYNPATREVVSLETPDLHGLEVLEDEYVVLEDGTILKVCTDCHEYALDENGDCPECDS